MTTKALADIHRGDKLVSPSGLVTVTSFTHNWSEDFSSKGKRSTDTVTVLGTLPDGTQARLTAARTTLVEVQA